VFLGTLGVTSRGTTEHYFETTYNPL